MMDRRAFLRCAVAAPLLAKLPVAPPTDDLFEELARQYALMEVEMSRPAILVHPRLYAELRALADAPDEP